MGINKNEWPGDTQELRTILIQCGWQLGKLSMILKFGRGNPATKHIAPTK